MTPEQLQGGLAFVAMVTILIAFLSSAIESRKRQCREEGHIWKDAEVWNPRSKQYEIGLVCDRCDEEPR